MISSNSLTPGSDPGTVLTCESATPYEGVVEKENPECSAQGFADSPPRMTPADSTTMLSSVIPHPRHTESSEKCMSDQKNKDLIELTQHNINYHELYQTNLSNNQLDNIKSVRYEDGFLPIPSKIYMSDRWSSLTSDQKTLVITVYVLASHKDKSLDHYGKKFLVRYGQCVITDDELAATLNISKQTVQRWLEDFTKEGWWRVDLLKSLKDQGMSQLNRWEKSDEKISQRISQKIGQPVTIITTLLLGLKFNRDNDDQPANQPANQSRISQRSATKLDILDSLDIKSPSVVSLKGDTDAEDGAARDNGQKVTKEEVPKQKEITAGQGDGEGQSKKKRTAKRITADPLKFDWSTKEFVGITEQDWAVWEKAYPLVDCRTFILHAQQKIGVQETRYSRTKKIRVTLIEFFKREQESLASRRTGNTTQAQTVVGPKLSELPSSVQADALRIVDAAKFKGTKSAWVSVRDDRIVMFDQGKQFTFDMGQNSRIDKLQSQLKAMGLA